MTAVRRRRRAHDACDLAKPFLHRQATAAVQLRTRESDDRKTSTRDIIRSQRSLRFVQFTALASINCSVDCAQNAKQ